MIRARAFVLGVTTLILVACGAAATPTTARSRVTGLLPITRSSWCMTEGKAGPANAAHRIHVDEGAARGVVAGDHSRSAELAFSYHGPSMVSAPLASGELRRQIGLKLRARDSCNVVYVMWHLAPTQGIFVEVKNTPNATTHAQCGATGYAGVVPSSSAPAPRVERGAPHVLHAALSGLELRVTADGQEVWRGRLPEATLSFDGPVGVRTDNGAFDVELRVPGGDHPGATCPPRP